MDRTELNRALAKVIAYKNCGKEKEVADWFARLTQMLGY